MTREQEDVLRGYPGILKGDLAGLTQTEKLVVVARLGLLSEGRMTFPQIAAYYRVSSGRVRHIMKKALAKVDAFAEAVSNPNRPALRADDLFVPVTNYNQVYTGRGK